MRRQQQLLQLLLLAFAALATLASAGGASMQDPSNLTGTQRMRTLLGDLGSATVNGTLGFGSSTVWFDPTQGQVPTGFGNSVPGPVTIKDTWVEFAYAEPGFQLEVDITTAGLITFNASASGEDYLNNFDITLTSAAFAAAKGFDVVSTFSPEGGAITTKLNATLINLNIPSTLVKPEQNKIYSFQLQLPQCSSGACCDTNGVFKANTIICRSSVGVCDVEEKCTGTSADCPQDGFKGQDTVCRPAAGDCDVPEYCTGTSSACVSPDAHVADGHACIKLVFLDQQKHHHHGYVKPPKQCHGSCLAGTCTLSKKQLHRCKDQKA